MEKYTKEGLAGLSQEELENAVLSLQEEAGNVVKEKSMYYDWYVREQEEKEGLRKKLETLHNLMHTWG